MSKLSYVLQINGLVDQLLDAQEQQQKVINQMLQSMNDYAAYCEKQAEILTKEK